MAVYDYDDGGASDAPALVFLHAALADRRMWHPQMEAFKGRHALLAIDLCGFGEHAPGAEPFRRAANVVAAMDEVGIDRAVMIGTSMGSRVALDIAATAPDRVAGLVLFAPVGPRHDWSTQVQQMWAAEETALEAGDLDAAVAVNLEFWLDGPNRAAANVPADDRTLVEAMQRRSFELELAHPDAGPEIRFEGLDAHLEDLAVPTSLVYGTEDAADIAQIAEHLAATMPEAELHAIANTAHLPSLEAPAVCNDLISQLVGRAR